MIIDGYSYDILRHISPRNIEIYLRACGWKRERETKTFDIYSDTLSGELIAIPNSADYSDYPHRIDEVIKTLSDISGKSIQNITRALLSSTASNIVEYHYEPYSNEEGLIPAQTLIDLVGTGMDLNNYAYRDLEEYRISYPTSNWYGRKHLDSVRVGPTFPGSYIVQFLFPANDGKGFDFTLDCEAASNELTKICDKLESSLDLIIDAATRNKNELEQGSKVSYNFVQSLMDLKFDDGDVVIKRTRAFARKEAPRQFHLSKKIFNRIAIIEDNMRPEEMRTEQEYVGRITVLRDPRQELNNEPAEVTITFVDTDGKARNATISLRGSDLNKAYEASSTRRNVKITGRMVGSNHRHFDEYSDFKIL